MPGPTLSKGVDASFGAMDQPLSSGRVSPSKGCVIALSSRGWVTPPSTVTAQCGQYNDPEASVAPHRGHAVLASSIKRTVPCKASWSLVDLRSRDGISAASLAAGD